MKKTAFIIAWAVILFTFIGCGGGSESTVDSAPRISPHPKPSWPKRLRSGGGDSEDSTALYPLEYFPRDGRFKYCSGRTTIPTVW